jgi:hypothetical protein
MCIDMGVGMLEIAGSQLNDWFFAGKDRKDNDAGGDHSGKIVFEEHGRDCGFFFEAEYSTGH